MRASEDPGIRSSKWDDEISAAITAALSGSLIDRNRLYDQIDALVLRQRQEAREEALHEAVRLCEKETSYRLVFVGGVWAWKNGTVRVMAIAEGYAMVRYKGCIPFAVMVRELSAEGTHVSG